MMKPVEPELADSPAEDTDLAIITEKKLRQLIATHRGKLGVYAQKQNEVKEFMDKHSVADVDKGFQGLIDALNEFDKLICLCKMIGNEERTPHHL